MSSVAHESRKALEARGEYIVKANLENRFFAVFPKTWQKRTEQAMRDGREGPNLIVYRNKTEDDRDHYVIPHRLIRDLFVDDTLAPSKDAGSRWNGDLKNGKLHVTHSHRDIDVAQFHRVKLLTEEGSDSADLILANEVEENSSYQEGSVQTILVNRYERDPHARAACVAHYGPTCRVCDDDFVSTYGPLMAGFTHVHHLKPLSTLGPDYTVDPIADLRPVCPNCHAVIHRTKPPFSLEEVRAMMNRLPE